MNVVDHYPLYYAMLTLQAPPPVERIPIFTIKDFFQVENAVRFQKSLPEYGNEVLCKF